MVTSKRRWSRRTNNGNRRDPFGRYIGFTPSKVSHLRNTATKMLRKVNYKLDRKIWDGNQYNQKNFIRRLIHFFIISRMWFSSRKRWPFGYLFQYSVRNCQFQKIELRKHKHFPYRNSQPNVASPRWAPWRISLLFKCNFSCWVHEMDTSVRHVPSCILRDRAIKTGGILE